MEKLQVDFQIRDFRSLSVEEQLLYIKMQAKEQSIEIPQMLFENDGKINRNQLEWYIHDEVMAGNISAENVRKQLAKLNPEEYPDIDFTDLKNSIDKDFKEYYEWCDKRNIHSNDRYYFAEQKWNIEKSDMDIEFLNLYQPGTKVEIDMEGYMKKCNSNYIADEKAYGEVREIRYYHSKHMGVVFDIDGISSGRQLGMEDVKKFCTVIEKYPPEIEKYKNSNKQIIEDLKKNKFQPTKSLVNNITKLSLLIGSDVSISDVSKIYSGIRNPEIQDIVKNIAKECAMQEKQMGASSQEM